MAIKIIDNNSLIDSIKIINTELINFSNKVIKLFIENNDNLLKNKLTAILNFSKNFKNINNYIHTNEIFVKKIKKIVRFIDTDNLEFLLIKENNYETPTKYINNIINKI